MTETIRFGARLRAARKAAGFNTSIAFLKKYKVPASTYSQHESGARSPDDETLQYYSKVFKVNFNWLKSGIGQPFSRPAPSKKNIMTEELLDLNVFKAKKCYGGTQINSKLLAKIISELIDFHSSINSKQSLYAIIKDAITLYCDAEKSKKSPNSIKNILINYKKKIS